MRRDKIERWLPALALVVICAILAPDAYAEWGLHPAAVAVLVVTLLVAAWWVSPLHRGPHVDHVRAQARAGDEDLIIYWKPGCSHCIRLLSGLDRSERDQVTWVNVWKDDTAAAFVADRNDGNVLTPTVVTGSGRRLPMTVSAVTSHLENHRAAQPGQSAA